MRSLPTIIKATVAESDLRAYLRKFFIGIANRHLAKDMDALMPRVHAPTDQRLTISLDFPTC